MGLLSREIRSYGVDGCRGGWFAVCWENPEASFVFPTLCDLWAELSSASRILVDIPIGLPCAERRCEILARKMLGKSSSRVFSTPPRPAVFASNYAEANATSRAMRGKGISKQFWMICPKVRQADELMTTFPEARTVVRECHPEICFYGMNGRRPILSSKHEPDGIAERLQLLERESPGVSEKIVRATQRWKRVAGIDDVIDALAAAWCAAAPDDEMRSLPAIADRDERGIAVEMVYRVMNEADTRP